MLEHRTQKEHLKPFFKDLPDAIKVEWVCTDMWRPFKRSFAQYLPNAKLVIDKFHVVKMASEALEAERKNFSGTVKQEIAFTSKVHSLAHPEATRQPNARRAKALEVVKQAIPALPWPGFKEAFATIYDETTSRALRTPLRLGRTACRLMAWSLSKNW